MLRYQSMTVPRRHVISNVPRSCGLVFLSAEWKEDPGMEDSGVEELKNEGTRCRIMDETAFQGLPILSLTTVLPYDAE